MAIKLNSCPPPVSTMYRKKKNICLQMDLVCWTLFTICTYSKKAVFGKMFFHLQARRKPTNLCYILEVQVSVIKPCLKPISEARYFKKKTGTPDHVQDIKKNKDAASERTTADIQIPNCPFSTLFKMECGNTWTVTNYSTTHMHVKHYPTGFTHIHV